MHQSPRSVAAFSPARARENSVSGTFPASLISCGAMGWAKAVQRRRNRGGGDDVAITLIANIIDCLVHV